MYDDTKHTDTAKKTIAIINATALEANGSHEGANWLGNRTGEGEKGGKGGGDLLRPLCQCPRYPCRLIPILVREIQPAIYKIGRNTSYRIKKIHDTESEEYLLCTLTETG